MTLPDFVIIGGQRCGSTSLYRCLLENPLLAGTSVNEVHYFDLNYDRGTRWYLDQFSVSDDWLGSLRRGQRLWMGEKSPYYLFHPLVPERLVRLMPEARLIVLLRDPVERAVSHYYHEVRLGVETLPLEEALQREPERLAGEEERILADPSYLSVPHRHFSYVARGAYADQLERWWQYFPREQLLLLRSEDLFENPRRVYAEAVAFVGAPPHQPGSYPHHNAGRYARVDDALRKRLAAQFAPHNARLEQLTGRSFGWSS